MSVFSKIEWTESTWNPLTGCTKISAGCTNCYAERLSTRLKAMGNPFYKNGFKLTLHDEQLKKPFGWKKPKVVFVNSMSDLFHEDVPFEFIMKVFSTMVETSQHTYQILTKRSEKLRQLSNSLPWQDNIWMGVTVESGEYLKRIDHLRKTGARIKFISMEPLIGPVDNIELNGIDWVIVGGESGPRARPMKKEWILALRDQCQQERVPFFFKQWGGTNKKRTGRLLEGRTWDEYPCIKSRIREQTPFLPN